MTRSTRARHTALTRTLHWISAAVILWATLSGLFAAFCAGDGLRSLIACFNVSLTTLFIPVFVLRVGNALLAPRPRSLPLSRRRRRAASCVHAALYVLTAVVLVSGVLMMDHDFSVFGWFTLRRLVHDRATNRLFGTVHRAAALGLATLVALHIAAVIDHERTGTRVLHRMGWRRTR